MSAPAVVVPYFSEETFFSEEKKAKDFLKREGFGEAYSKQNKAKSRSVTEWTGYLLCAGKRKHSGSNPPHAKNGAASNHNAIRRAG